MGNSGVEKAQDRWGWSWLRTSGNDAPRFYPQSRNSTWQLSPLNRICVTILQMRLLIPLLAFSISPRTAVDAGNRAWIDGIKSGNFKLIASTYTDDAVDCGPTGECIQGRVAIEQHMKTELASRGKARSATVQTWGRSQQGNFIYEWGQAEAQFDGGNRLIDKYLTVWQKQPDGGWKIFRNMVIPAQ